MYNHFFGFKERPFKLVPNPEYLYLSRIHEEVLAHLNYAAGYGEGFVEITGEVGTGKTTLCRMFLENLDENTEAAYIFNPKLDALQLLKSINDEFGIPSDTESVKTLIDRLNTFLLEKKAQRKRVILLIDEAQNLGADVLEQLRLLSNLETTTSKLLQIILVGQPELGALLESDVLRQLNQRIALSCHLIPLSFSETQEYIRHRIHIASRKPGLVFTAGALRSIFNYTGGVPRLINIACDRALLTAFTLGQHRITNSVVKRAIRELDGKKIRPRHQRVYREKLIITLLVVLVVLVAGLIVGLTVLNRHGWVFGERALPLNVEQSPSPPTPAVLLEEEEPIAEVAESPPPPQPLVAEPSTEEDAAPTAQAATVETVQPPPIQDLEQMIVSTNTLESRIGALKAVLTQWNSTRPLDIESVDGVDDDTFFRVAVRQRAMEVLRVQGNLNLIRKLNLPAILEFSNLAGNRSRFLAIVGIEDNILRLSDGDQTHSIAQASLAGRWNGVAYIPWKNYYNYVGIIPISSPGEVIISLKVHLKIMGFPIESMTAAYDIATRSAIETIQARYGLDVDGMVGPLTKIVLYNEDNSLNVPRLVGLPSE